MFWNIGVGIGFFLLFISPWIFALHQKYNIWSVTGLAGKLNMSWYINSGKIFTSDIKLLIPPTYSDSPSFWEDPYPTQILSTPFSSFAHFCKWMARCAHTFLQALSCFNELSCFALLILFAGLVYFFTIKKNRPQIQILLFAIAIMPLAYLSMHIETRYIWLSGILLFVLSSIFLMQMQKPNCPIGSMMKNYKKANFFSSILLLGSFVVFPLLQINVLKNKNKNLFAIAKQLNENHIQGTFTSNVSDAGNMWVIAYLTHSQFYTIEKTDYSEDELVEELNRYKVKYYFLQIENKKVHADIVRKSFAEKYQRLPLNINDLEIFERK
jgi:hypothetical protein